jgi:hypothetical protein
MIRNALTILILKLLMICRFTLLANFRLFLITFTFVTFNVSFSNSFASSPAETTPKTCDNLKRLYQFRFSLQQTPECNKAFGDFKTKLTAAYNFCLAEINEQQVVCNERGNTMKALQKQMLEIHKAIVKNPKELAQELLDFRVSSEMKRIDQCVRQPDDSPVTRQEFVEILNEAVQEFSPTTRIYQPGERRVSEDVPFAWMSKSDKQIISTIAGAALWRARGGGVMLGSTHAARLIFATGGYGLLGWFNGGTDGIIAGGLTSVPLWIYGWGKFMDMGTSKKKGEPGAAAHDFAMMTGRGLFQTSLSGGYLLSQGYDGWALGSGASMGACYLGSHHATRQNSWMTSGKWFDGANAYGEMCSGAMIGLGLSTTLQNGTTGKRFDF